MHRVKAEASVTESWRRRATLALVLIILGAPSAWLLTAVPPLWRDMDAYTQVATPPSPGNILLHGPLYSFLARLPLYVGYAVAHPVDAPVRSVGEFLISPSLTDAGVFLLIALQHAALAAAQFFFITTVTRVTWLRVSLAIALATIPLLYTFAHCVGSETLSAIGTIVLAASGLRIVRAGANPPLPSWSIFAVTLMLLMLTRQINAALAALLPLALVILVVWQAVRAAFGGNAEERGAIRGYVVPMALAIALGVGSLVATYFTVRHVADAADVAYRSRIGFTFMWRLKFLDAAPRQERAAFLLAAAARADSAETKRALELLAAEDERPVNVVEFLGRARAAIFPRGTGDAAAEIDRAINRIPAAVFASSPGKLIEVAVADFRGARKMSVAHVTGNLFVTTEYFFKFPEMMPELSKLVTYRHFDVPALAALAERRTYFRWWSMLSFNAWMGIWLAACCALVWFGRQRRVDVAVSCSYAAALLLIGLLMMAANCFFTELLPRYTLPMFALMFLSLVILVSRIAEVVAAERVTPATTP